MSEISPVTRRHFLWQLSGAAGAAVVASRASFAQAIEVSAQHVSRLPWFQTATRWGQTNLTEIDPLRFDVAWWRKHWRRTRIRGVVINAGGIVAYYPTQVAHQRRAAHLGARDLFGELLQAAHEDGLAVFARMDSNRAGEDVLRAKPEWFTRDRDGNPYVVTGLYVACVNSAYYDEYIPSILQEVAGKYRPEGFTDNNWNGAMRHQPCFCENCERKFRAKTGRSIPRVADWNDKTYRQWIVWNYERRLEIWDLFNRVTRAAGGPECIWVGMMAGSQNWQARVFRDDREIYRRAELIMLDHQRRFDDEGLQHNGETGKRLHSVGGWKKVIPESMAMYHLTENNFRLVSKPEPEVRLWAFDGIAGGIQPWWHHVGSEQQDSRMLSWAEPIWKWHEANEEYLANRTPVAKVGLLWSQRNMDFFGRDEGGANVDEPWNGFTQALIRARIAYVPVHVDDIERVSKELGLKLLILPNLAAVSDAQVEALRAFVAAGGSLLGTGLSTLCNEWGDTRGDFALGNLFGVSAGPDHPWRNDQKRTELAKGWNQTYLRLTPELRANFDAPKSGDEPVANGVRHEILKGFDATDILPFGGTLNAVAVAADAKVLLTYVPPVAVAPAESVWMKEIRTDIAGLVVRDLPQGGRSVFLAADIDRRFARDYLPDHGDLIANLVRWAVREPQPIEVRGAGLIDCHLYAQSERHVLHLVNLTNASTWRTPVHELISIGPLEVTLNLPRSPTHVRSLVTGETLPVSAEADGVSFTVAKILDHDVLVIE